MTTEESIQKRKTLKLRADPHNPLPVLKDDSFRLVIEELIDLAGKAPFHFECHPDRRRNDSEALEPWRFYILDSSNCRTLLDSLNQDIPLKAPEGIRQMLAAADALIITTWLPEPSRKKTQTFYPNLKNMEHIAAAGAAIQNLLLAATSKGINAYWSSGGILRKPKSLRYLGIPDDQIILGAIFIFPDNYPDSVKIKTGKNAGKRGEIREFMQWIDVR